MHLSGRNGGTKSDESSQQRVIHLSLLSARDGRHDLVETTRRLAEQATNGQLVRFNLIFFKFHKKLQSTVTS